MAGMAMQKSEFHRPNRTRLLTLQLYVQMRRDVANTVAFRNEISERGVAARAGCLRVANDGRLTLGLGSLPKLGLWLGKRSARKHSTSQRQRTRRQAEYLLETSRYRVGVTPPASPGQPGHLYAYPKICHILGDEY